MSSINEALRRAGGSPGPSSGPPSFSFRRPPGKKPWPWIFLVLVLIGLGAVFWFVRPDLPSSAVERTASAPPAATVAPPAPAPAAADDAAQAEALPAQAPPAALNEAADEFKRLEAELARLDAQVSEVEAELAAAVPADDSVAPAADQAAAETVPADEPADAAPAPEPVAEPVAEPAAKPVEEPATEEPATAPAPQGIEAEAGRAQDDFLAGKMAQDAGRDSQAVYHYRQALLKDPHLVEAYLNLGNIFYFRQRSPEKAREMYAQVLSIDPEHKMAHNNIGVILLQEGLDSQAQTQFTAALQQDPDYVDALYNIACVYARRGEPDQAMTHLARAAALQPEAAIWASEDDDLKTLWARSDFKGLVKGSLKQKPQG